MTVVRLKYVHKFPGRNGKTRYYLRKPGHKQAKLPDPSSPDFYSEYQRLMHGGAEKIVVGSTLEGSLVDLISKWRTSHKYHTIKQSTRQVYDRILNRLAAMECAQGAVKHMGPQNVRFIMRQHEASSPTTANRMLSILVTLLDYAVELGWRDTNPTHGAEDRCSIQLSYQRYTLRSFAGYLARAVCNQRPGSLSLQWACCAAVAS